LRDLIRSLADRGRTVLVSSHILAEVAQTVDSVVILNHGRLVTHSTLAELSSRGRPTVRVRTPKAEQLRDVLTIAGIGAKITAPERVKVIDATGEEVATLAAERAIPLYEISTEQVNLEDVFLELTATKIAEEDSP
jgi:ABC-2 type transport system ATP-binding protein